jgi:hypothetical protein
MRFTAKPGENVTKPGHTRGVWPGDAEQFRTDRPAVLPGATTQPILAALTRIKAQDGVRG